MATDQHHINTMIPSDPFSHSVGRMLCTVFVVCSFQHTYGSQRRQFLQILSEEVQKLIQSRQTSSWRNWAEPSRLQCSALDLVGEIIVKAFAES